MAEEERKTRWVRTSKTRYVRVDAETGVDPKTGEIPEEWDVRRNPKRKLISDVNEKIRVSKRELKELTAAKLVKSVVEFPWEKDPNAAEWCKRDPQEAYQWARLAFIQEAASIAAIAHKTGFTVDQIKTYAFRSSSTRQGWKREKEFFQNQLLKGLMKTTKERCEVLMSTMLDVVQRRIMKLNDNVEEGEALKVGEVKALVKAIKEVHEISQLESGDPTKIVQNVKMSREDILAALKEADPLVSYEKEEDESVDSKTTH